MPSVYIKKADRIEMNKKQPVPFKRPRGRPPLSAKRKFEVLEQHNDKANFTAEKLQQNISSTATQKSSTHTHDIDDNAKKISRSQSIVQSIIDILLTSEPSTLSRIASRIPEASKEFVQSTLEILQILGIAVQIKQRESKAVDIRQITEAIEQKKKNLEKIQSRISLLKELTFKDMPEDERRIEFKRLLEQLLRNDPTIKEDPLFRDVMIQAGVRPTQVT